MWGDSDVYKTLEGMAAALRLRPDPTMSERMEQIIGDLAAAQAADGYLFPHLQLAEPGCRHFADETTRTCESYSMGHLIESAVAHYRLTGRTNYLAVARRAADLLRRAHAGGELLRLSGHPEVELALIKLHEATGEQAGLDLSASLVENARRLNTLWSQGRPPLADDEAHGHAVVMLYLYSAATDLALRQDTRYPRDGRVRIEFLAAPAEPVALHLRIPGWAKGRPLPTDLYRYADSGAEPVTLLLNGRPARESGQLSPRRAGTSEP